MVKNILVKMLDSGDVEVLVNDESSLVIPVNSRNIKADDIYTLLDYRVGDIYSVEESNEHEKDANVLKFFADLMREITSQLNDLTHQETKEVTQ